MANVLGICILLGLVAFITAMVVGIVKRVREIQKEKKKKAQSTTDVVAPVAEDDKNKEKEVNE